MTGFDRIFADRISDVPRSFTREILKVAPDPSVISGGLPTRPEGGMFLWAALPEDMAALDLFELAMQDKVVFVPGDPLNIDGRRSNALRLNFSCVDEETIETGIQRLGNAIARLLDREPNEPESENQNGRRARNGTRDRKSQSV